MTQNKASQAQIDNYWMQQAIELSKQCPATDKAYSVGSVIVTKEGACISSGFSREYDNVHAEEAAIKKIISKDHDLSVCTLYSTMEPCSERLSGATSCVQHILESGIRRVCFALREPPLFVQCTGKEDLQRANIEVYEMHQWANEVLKMQNSTISQNT
jgi:pyrimidine deaminase RibD-like protein